jgi:hypothetical protein
MSGKRFLNPFLKVVLSLIGMSAVGYQLYIWFGSGEPYDTLTIVRGLLFAGFLYLFLQSLRQLMSRPNE